EWHWVDEKGKEKHPYYVHLPGQKIFSVAGLYYPWYEKATDKLHWTYTLLTGEANPLMARIHNNKKRMPIIIEREYEKDWLNPNLTKEDVLALCRPFDEKKMEAYTVSKRITSRKEPTNVPQTMQKFNYEATTLF
ncbi:MAG TPA: SOS response-associated peptidase family protein, partial [Cyclobacteriaceae bacterium]|nr:SOS response-associated peptidase family protein [Cyclobacteriaceae bacterium]